MVSLILVSHSADLANAVKTLALEMAPTCRIELAAGIDDPDHPIGTDTVKIMQVIEEIADEAIIFVDIGSAVLSAQTAVELVDRHLAEKISITDAPFVEGVIAAAVSASGGATRDSILADAKQALASKQAMLAQNNDNPQLIDNTTLDANNSLTVTIENAAGLHARPAAKIASTLRKFRSDITIIYQDKQANAKKMAEIMGLAIKQGDTIELCAKGEDAPLVLESFQALATNHFGD